VAEKKGNRGKPRGKIAEHQLNILEFPENPRKSMNELCSESGKTELPSR